MSKHSFLVIHT